MSLSTQPYKGARDFYPEDKRFQKWMFAKWRSAVESFGYEEYDAPIIEPIELYTTKTSDEIVTEQTYVFEDRGKRTVTIRPEMTPSVSRMVAAKRQELSYPLRWYSIPNLWRYERPQRGRLREHWQLNVDVFGVDNNSAELEIIQVADSILQSVGAKRDNYTIKLNSRKLINELMTSYLGLGSGATEDLIRLVDRMHKLEEHQFQAKLEIIAPDKEQQKLIKSLLSSKSLTDLPSSVKDHASVKQLSQLMQSLENLKITNAQFDITLMRGFDYYTDVVFEVFDNHPENNRAMFGGGRYSGLVGMFGVEPVEAVGFGMGDVTFANFLESHDLMPKLRPHTDLQVILIGEVNDDFQPILSKMRENGANIAVDTTNRKLDKQIKSAAKNGVRYVMFVGEKELESEQFKLKDLVTGQEEVHSAERIVTIVKDYRNS